MVREHRRGKRPWYLLLALFMALAVLAAACGSDDDDDGGAADDSSSEASADDSSSGDSSDEGSSDDGGDDGGSDDAPAGDTSINVAIVGNPQMEDIASLTPDLFTAETGIAVEYTFLEEQTLREIVTRDVGAGGEQFDVVMIGMFEAPQFGANELARMTSTPTWADDDPSTTSRTTSSTAVRRWSLVPRAGFYAAPFYAESSFMMYRQDVHRPRPGWTMPDAPTWEEVAEIARAVDSDEMAGICLRGKPGWGDLGGLVHHGPQHLRWHRGGSPTTTVRSAKSQVDQPEFAKALNFYVDLVNDAGRGRRGQCQLQRVPEPLPER